jgi:hypothetical protein
MLVVCLVLSQVGMSQRVEPLWPRWRRHRHRERGRRAGRNAEGRDPDGALPLLIVFFVAIGTSLRLDTLATAGLAAVGLALVRLD